MTLEQTTGKTRRPLYTRAGVICNSCQWSATDGQLAQWRMAHAAAAAARSCRSLSQPEPGTVCTL